MTPEKRKLVVSLDEFEDTPSPPQAASPPPAAYTAPAPAAQAFPLVGGSAATAPARPALTRVQSGVNLGSVRARSVMAGAAGVAIGWLVTEVSGIGGLQAGSRLESDLQAGLWVAILGFCFSVAFAGWDHVEGHNVEGILVAVRRAGPWGAGLGFAAGFLANVIYLALIEQAIESLSTSVLYLARAIGWAVFGLGMGLTTAALVRARAKMVNGAIGGVAGGAVGGLCFEYVAEHVSAEASGRLFGLLVIGAGIGLAIGLVETARRSAWLHVTGGGMTGKEFILYDVETKVGSSPKCEITLIKDPAIAPFHFVVTGGGTGGRRVITAHSGCQLTINGTPVAQHQLRNGDLIGVGRTSLAYAERTL